MNPGPDKIQVLETTALPAEEEPNGALVSSQIEKTEEDTQLPQPLDTAEETTVAETSANAGEEPGWLRRNLFKVSAATFIGGVALTLGTNPFAGVEKEVLDAAPWVGGGMALTESMWIGGAALMAAGTGKNIGNPLTLRSRWGEISQDIFESKTFKTGLAINTLGALGTAGVVSVGAVTSLPPETWPGALGVAAADMASTAAIRGGLYASVKQVEVPDKEKAKPGKVTVRKATENDINRLADLDILLFDKAYGSEAPQKREVVEMLAKRYRNNPDWMFVSEMNGEIEGFVSAFRTSTPLEDFVSWEHSTNNGTLEDKVDPKGKYVYVTNMTIKHEAVERGAEDMLLANLFANGIKDGVEYGYFVSRMPHFKRWVEAQQIAPTEGNVQAIAEQYMGLRGEDGKRYDPQLRMYEDYGFKPQRMVQGAFEDNASLNFGVVFKAAVPPSKTLKKIKPVRSALAGTLRQVAKKPKLLKKVL